MTCERAKSQSDLRGRDAVTLSCSGNRCTCLGVCADAQGKERHEGDPTLRAHVEHLLRGLDLGVGQPGHRAPSGA
jgi:hypothetical protein